MDSLVADNISVLRLLNLSGEVDPILMPHQALVNDRVLVGFDRCLIVSLQIAWLRITLDCHAFFIGVIMGLSESVSLTILNLDIELTRHVLTGVCLNNLYPGSGEVQVFFIVVIGNSELVNPIGQFVLAISVCW